MSPNQQNAVEIRCRRDQVGEVLAILRRYSRSDFRVCGGKLSAVEARLALSMSGQQVRIATAIAELRDLGARVAILGETPTAERMAVSFAIESL